MLYWLVRVRFSKVVGRLKLPEASSGVPAMT